MEQEDKIQEIGSFDDFLNPQVQSTPEQTKETDNLFNRFAAERLQWTKTIKEMSENFKNVMKISDLMLTVYTDRQRAVEYYHYLISLLVQINKKYRKAYAEKYDFYSYKSQKRFPNETTKNNQIQTELEDILEKRELIENHSKFMENTIKSADQMIYGVKYRIEIEQIARGK